MTLLLPLQHKVELKEDEVGELVVDTRGLQVASAKAAGAPAEFSFGEAHKVSGGAKAGPSQFGFRDSAGQLLLPLQRRQWACEWFLCGWAVLSSGLHAFSKPDMPRDPDPWYVATRRCWGRR